MIACVRYVKNNFMDGSRQDSFDLFLGVFVVNPSVASPFVDDAEKSTATVMVCLIDYYNCV